MAFAARRPDACLAITRALLRGSRHLHDDVGVFLRVVQGKLLPTMNEEEGRALWRGLLAAGAFAVNGGTSRARWGRRLEKLAAEVQSLDMGSKSLRTLTYEGFVVCAHAATAVAQLGRHPSFADPV